MDVVSHAHPDTLAPVQGALLTVDLLVAQIPTRCIGGLDAACFGTARDQEAVDGSGAVETAPSRRVVVRVRGREGLLALRVLKLGAQ